MRRRRLLSGFVAGAAGLAGCSALENSGDRDPYGVPNDTATDERTTTSTTTANVAGPQQLRDPGVEVVSTLRPPSEVTRAVDWTVGDGKRLVLVPGPAPATPEGTELTVGFTRPANGDGPARLWVGLVNGADRELRIGFGATPPFSGYYGDVHASVEAPPPRTGLLVIPDDDRNYASYDYVVPDEPTDGCWRAVGPAVGPPVRSVVDVPPGQGIAGEYVALAPNDALQCLPPRATIAFGSEEEEVGFAVRVWQKAEAAPGESRFDRTVPPLPEFERTLWFHDAGPETPVYLAPRHERLELEADSTAVVLRNFSATPLAIDPGGWDLYKLYRGDWKHVAPWVTPTRSTTVPPGDEHSLPFLVDNDPDRDREETPDVATVSGLGGGLYAVRHGGFALEDVRAAGVMQLPAGDPPTRDGPPPIACAALVGVSGAPLSVPPTPAVRETTRSGSTLTVTVGDPDDRAVLVMRRAPDREPSLELIPEQVMQVPALQDAVAHLTSDVETVRVVTDEFDATEPLDRFVPGADRLVVRYQGSTYVLTVG